MLPLFAQFVGGSILYYAIAIIVIAGIIAVVWVVTKQMGVAIPPFIITVLWIVLAVIIGVVAVKFIAGIV